MALSNFPPQFYLLFAFTFLSSDSCELKLTRLNKILMDPVHENFLLLFFFLRLVRSNKMEGAVAIPFTVNCYTLLASIVSLRHHNEPFPAKLTEMLQPIEFTQYQSYAHVKFIHYRF